MIPARAGASSNARPGLHHRPIIPITEGRLMTKNTLIAGTALLALFAVACGGQKAPEAPAAPTATSEAQPAAPAANTAAPAGGSAPAGGNGSGSRSEHPFTGEHHVADDPTRITVEFRRGG